MKRILVAIACLVVTSPAALAQGYDWGDSRYGYRERPTYRPYYGPPPGYYRAPPSFYREPAYRQPYFYREPAYRQPYYRDPYFRGAQPYRRGSNSFLDDDERFFQRHERRRDQFRDDDDFSGPKLVEGGPRPHINPLPPQQVDITTTYAPGTIVIETAGRQLFLIGNDGAALRYPISVGRDGFQWQGTEKISRIAAWPDWHPPAEMRERDPKLPEKMTGGLRNPLGAKALYLGNTLYRIHGTNDAKSIGYASSSGCFRMLNGHVLDLAERVGVGTPVVVIERLPPHIARSLPPYPYPRRAS